MNRERLNIILEGDIMSLRITTYGNYSDTKSWLKQLKFDRLMKKLDSYGQDGVNALREATPKDTGYTSECWSYEIVESPGSIQIMWKNSNVVNGVPIAIILQYGHGTRNGGYVEGIDYINPAMKPVFDDIVNKIWEEINSL